MVTHRCSKAKEIDAMAKAIAKLNKVVLDGNGGDSLQFMAKQTRDLHQQTNRKVDEMKVCVRALIKFQTKTEVEKKMEERILRWKELRNPSGRN